MKSRSEIKRINGYLKEVTTFYDQDGEVISSNITPLALELRPRDILQIFVGAFLVAAPLCFTEEVWSLSIELGRYNVYALGGISLLTATSYIYLNSYRFRLKGHVWEFLKRVMVTYLVTAMSIILILSLIGKFPILEQAYIAIKRVILIGFPSIFGAVISDNIK